MERTVEAASRNGATLLRITHRGFRYHLVPSDNYDRSRIVLPLTRQTLEIEHTFKQFREMGGVRSFVEMWTDELDCRKRAEWAGEHWKRTDREPVVAGVRGIEYLYQGGETVQRIVFAPSLGCIAIEFQLSRRSASGLPISEDHMKLLSAVVGEPDRALFAIPAGYQMSRSENPWPYISMNQFPGDITHTGFSRPLE